MSPLPCAFIAYGGIARRRCDSIARAVLLWLLCKRYRILLAQTNDFRYLLNPYTILSCVARSTTSVDNTLVVIAIASACGGTSVLHPNSSAIKHLRLSMDRRHFPRRGHSLIPISRSPLSGFRGSVKRGSAVQALHCLEERSSVLYDYGHDHRNQLAGLRLVLAASNLGCHVCASTSSLISLTSLSLSVSDLTPNVGMWWYFFTEMFDHFRSFFLGVFQVSLLPPLCAQLICIAALLDICFAHHRKIMATATACSAGACWSAEHLEKLSDRR